MLESSPLLRKRPVLSAQVREWCAGTWAASLMRAESLWLQARLASLETAAPTAPAPAPVASELPRQEG